MDTIAAFRHANDDQIVLTIRGIGELRPNNPATLVKLAGETDEFGIPRAFVSINPGLEDGILWNAMDTATDQVALIFANGRPYEVLSGPAFQPVAANQPASAVLAFPNRHDGLGTTHHEAGTLAMGDDPNTSVTNANARFHRVPNLYAAGPSLFPTVGSPNPMLTGTALARRLADNLAAPFIAQAGFTSLFDGASLQGWRMSTIRNQPGRNDPGRFVVTNGALVSVPGSDIGLLWHAQPTPPDYVLKLEWRRWQEDANSGVFLRFPDPESRNYDNSAFVAVDFGFEVQIDQLASPGRIAYPQDGGNLRLAGTQQSERAPRERHRRVEYVRDPGAGPELRRNPERRAGYRLCLRAGFRRRPSRSGFAQYQRRAALLRTSDTHPSRRLSQYPGEAAVEGERGPTHSVRAPLCALARPLCRYENIILLSDEAVLLTELSNVVAYPCRHSRIEDRQMATAQPSSGKSEYGELAHCLRGSCARPLMTRRRRAGVPRNAGRSTLAGH